MSATPRTQVQGVSYTYPGWRHLAGSDVNLWFSENCGLKVTVCGSDPVRVRSMASVIHDRASRADPSWTFLFSVRGYFLVWAVVFAVCYFLGLGVLQNLSARALHS